MKNRAIVSSRGTITIPGSIRVAAGVHPGDLVEFVTQKDKIILTHLIVKSPDREASLSSDEWDQLDQKARKQVKSGRYKNYNDLDRAKEHSRNLARGE